MHVRQGWTGLDWLGFLAGRLDEVVNFRFWILDFRLRPEGRSKFKVSGSKIYLVLLPSIGFVWLLLLSFTFRSLPLPSVGDRCRPLGTDGFRAGRCFGRFGRRIPPNFRARRSDTVEL